MQNYFLFKLLPDLFEDQTNFWISTLSFALQYSYDQRNAVACNSLI